MEIKEFISFLMTEGFLQNFYICTYCNNSCNLVPYTRNKDLMAWRCMNRNCKSYKKYVSVRINSFFDTLTADLRFILKIIIKYAAKIPLHNIKDYYKCDPRAIERNIKKLCSIIPEPYFNDNKLGGVGRIVQIDETLLNLKSKSHRGRSASNKSDALCIVEVANKITLVYATIIPDKSRNTILPIIMRQVAPNSVICTDEHSSYQNLNTYDYQHDTVYHKYNFINQVTGQYTSSRIFS
ncbi:hypothetical protein DMUE_2737 [Dictyocoela muelleri]|nr:hypothetical protein DMUE_2737 [Dictyocoela muelleri]